EVLLQGKPLGNESEMRQRLEAQLPQDPASSLNHVSLNLHLESITPLNTEIKKRSSKSQSKFMRISDPISSDNVDSTEKISEGGINNIPNTDIVAQIEREIKRKDKNLASSARIKSISDLQKHLRSALKDVDKKESYVLDLEQWLSTLEEESGHLKKENLRNYLLE
ncbi:14308_t:CDS:2, partial [Entrophospora sp. SA101]